MARPRTARDYEDDITVASRVGLAELMTGLGAYRDALVLIGGWAPYLILERLGVQGAFQADAFQGDAFQTGFAHVGSIDIDFVDRKSTRLNSSHLVISYAVFCLKKKKKENKTYTCI